MADKQDPQKTDMFGLAAYGEALNTLAKGTVDGAGAFLSRICLPAAEEFGLMLRDRISAWRANNAIIITQNTQTILFEQKRNNVHAHPRIAMKIINEGSWSDDDEVRMFWSGLLASSCTDDGRDESNLIFLNILSQITALQARIIDYACTNSKILLTKYGLIHAENLNITIDAVHELTACNELHRIDRELDHLRSMELIGGSIGAGGINISSDRVDITPTALTLHFYARCKGFIDPVENFYNAQKEETLEGA